MASKKWTATDCEKNLGLLLEHGFGPKSHRRLPGVSLRLRQYGLWKYRSSALEDGLKELFSDSQRLSHQSTGLQPDYGAHVAVLARSVGAHPIIFTNYPPKSTHSDSRLWEM
jgi:hypothetical protein